MFVVLIPCLVCKIAFFGYNHLQPFICLDLCFYGQGLFEDPFYVGKISGLAEMCSQTCKKRSRLPVIMQNCFETTKLDSYRGCAAASPWILLSFSFGNCRSALWHAQHTEWQLKIDALDIWSVGLNAETCCILKRSGKTMCFVHSRCNVDDQRKSTVFLEIYNW